MKITIHKIKKFFAHFFTLDDTPHNIAGGMALGVFLGTLPGVGLVATLLVAYYFKLNRASAIIGVLVTNMWATIITLPLAALMGGFIFGHSSMRLLSEFNRIYHLGLKYFFKKTMFFDLALPLTVGFFVVSLAIAFLSYALILILLKYFKVKK